MHRTAPPPGVIQPQMPGKPGAEPERMDLSCAQVPLVWQDCNLGAGLFTFLNKQTSLCHTHTPWPQDLFPPGGVLHPVGESGAGVFNSKMPAFHQPDEGADPWRALGLAWIPSASSSPRPCFRRLRGHPRESEGQLGAPLEPGQTPSSTKPVAFRYAPGAEFQECARGHHGIYRASGQQCSGCRPVPGAPAQMLVGPPPFLINTSSSSRETLINIPNICTLG